MWLEVGDHLAIELAPCSTHPNVDLFAKSFVSRQKIRAETTGCHHAQFVVGWCHDFAFGVEKDLEISTKFYGLALDKKNARAAQNLGSFFAQGQDHQQAFEMFSRAAEYGSISALCEVGRFYEEGGVVTKDVARGVETYKQCAEAGLPEAMCLYGICFRIGMGVEENFQKAFEW